MCKGWMGAAGGVVGVQNRHKASGWSQEQGVCIHRVCECHIPSEGRLGLKQAGPEGHGGVLRALGGFRGFRNDLIGAVPGGNGPSLSEAVMTVAEEGQAGADQGPGGHILAVTPVDALAWQWRQAALVATDGLVWPCCGLCRPRGATALLHSAESCSPLLSG